MALAITNRGRRASILMLVLWMVVILSIVALSFSASVRSQIGVAEADRGRNQAYWAAYAGVEFAKVVLFNYSQDEEIDLAALTDLDPIFHDPDLFFEQPVGESTSFTLFGGFETDGSRTQRYGLIDESSLLHVNRINGALLSYYTFMTEDMFDALEDWRDADLEPRPSGAEDDYYYLLDDPYPAANGPLMSVRELKRVRGWDLLFDSADPDPYLRFMPAEARPVILTDPFEAQLLLDSLTAWSLSPAADAPDGEPKINLAETGLDAREMSNRVDGLDQATAAMIAAFTGYTAVTDIMEFVPELETVVAMIEYFDYNPYAVEDAAAGNLGMEVVLGAAGGDTGGEEGPQPGLLNLNTAGLETLLSVPGMAEDTAWAIISAREEEPFQSVLQIAELPNMSAEIFRGVYPWLGVGTSRFRVVSHGYDESLEIEVVIEAVLELADNGEITIVHWRVQ